MVAVTDAEQDERSSLGPVASTMADPLLHTPGKKSDDRAGFDVWPINARHFFASRKF